MGTPEIKGDPFENWISGIERLPVEQRARNANPSGDGLDNLLKFYMGIDPTESLYAAAARFSRSKVPRILKGEKSAVVVYGISPLNAFNLGDRLYTDVVQSSIDGIEWNDLPEDARSSRPMDATQRWTIPHVVHQIYFRLKIERLPQ